MIRALTTIGSVAAVGAIVLFYAAGEDNGVMIALFLVAIAISLFLGARKAFLTIREVIRSRAAR